MIKIEEKLKVLFEDLYIKIKAGQAPESTKTEIKREWYNLSKSIKGEEYKINVSKFLKEIGAMANSYGPWPGHIIIGLGEDASIVDSPLSNSGLNDETELFSLVASCIDKPIRFNYYQILTSIDGSEKTISIIEVPVSIDKPHVMYEYVTKNGRYENYTPVKKGTAVRPASRSDFDLMYYDKQNIVPEYAVNISTFSGSELDIKKAGASISLSIPVVFENYGRKPIVITKCDIILLESDGLKLEPEITLNLGSYSQANKINTLNEVRHQPIIIGSNETLAFTCHFYSWEVILYEKVESRKLVGYFSAKDIFDKKYDSGKFRTYTI